MRTYYAKDAKTIIDAEKDWIKSHEICEIYKTNYTVKMKAGKKIIFFTKKMLTNKAFAAYKKIEKCVKNSGIELPEIDRDTINYFAFRPAPSYPEKLVIVDLNAAYPQAIKNMGYIDEPTLKYMLTLPKRERLQVTGMLATTKVEFLIEHGKIHAIIPHENPYKNVFFAACENVNSLLFEVFEKFPSFWYWVDGIAVTPEKAQEVKQFLEERGFPAKFEPVQSVKVNERTLTYIKEDGKKKVLFFPKTRPITDKNVISFLKRKRNE